MSEEKENKEIVFSKKTEESITIKSPNDESSKQFDEIIETLHVSLPKGDMTLTTKIIAFLTAAGGLSIIAGILADVVRPGGISLGFYLLRIIVGIIMILVGYGIIKRKDWVVWLYGGISLVSLFINPVVAIIPLIITFYLYKQKVYFNKNVPIKFINKIKSFWKEA